MTTTYFDALMRSLDSWFVDARRKDCPEHRATDRCVPVPQAHVNSLWTSVDALDDVDDPCGNIMLANAVLPPAADPVPENDIVPFNGCIQSESLCEGMTGQLLVSNGTSGGLPVTLDKGGVAGSFRMLLPSASNVPLLPYDTFIIPDKLHPLYPVDGTCAAITSKSIRFIRARDKVDVTPEVVMRLERGNTSGSVAMVVADASQKCSFGKLR